MEGVPSIWSSYTSGSDSPFYDIFNTFARAILSYFPPLDLFSSVFTAQSRGTFRSLGRLPFTTQVFSTILRTGENWPPSYFLPSLRTTKTGGPRRERGARLPARPLARLPPACQLAPPRLHKRARSLARSFVPLSARSFPSIHRRDCPPSSNAHLFCAECDYFWTRTNLSQELSITHNPIRNYKAIEPYIRGQCPV